MTVRDLARRTAFRVAVLFSGLFLATVAVIFAVLYQLITNEIEKKLKSHIVEVGDTLAAVSRNDGLDALSKMISQKGPPTEDDEDIYLVTDPSGRFVAGNVAPIPLFRDWRQLPWSSFSFIGKATKSRATTAVLSKWTQIDGGYLLVGDGNGDIEEAKELLLDGFEWGVVMTFAGALIGGAWLGFGAQRRIGRLETVLGAVAQGNLAVRVPISSAKDDLDFVGEHVNATVDHLKRAVEALAQVSSDIAHDLKTPIARIQQRIETALAASQTADDYRATLSEIKNDVSGVITTFEAILRIAQIEGGARKSRFVATDLAEVLTRVMEAYEYVGEDTNHRITLAPLPAEPMIIHGDSQLLTQLFANLIENAIRHTPPGSRIDVAAKRTGSSIEIAVRDNGPGIPKEERENVFRRLYRLDKSRTNPGSGLGLSLVAAITTLHDAQIALEDNQPGLIVRLTFPADHGSRLTSASHTA